MKNTLFIAVLIIGISCNSKKSNDSYQLQVELRGAQDSTLVKLAVGPFDNPEIIDSAFYTNGTLTFSGQATTPRFANLLIDGKRGMASVVLEPGAIELDVHVDTL